MNEWPLMNGLASIVAGMAVLRYLLEGVQVSRHNPLMKMAVVSSEFALQWIRPLISSLPGRDRSALFLGVAGQFCNGYVAVELACFCQSG